jgi:MHS family alpha-ketoglutarate permease-like MFS transporter
MSTTAVTAADASPAPPAAGARLRSILGGSLGNLVEWYDWFVYASFALYFSKSFFPVGDPTAQLLNTSGVFALGFLMRPVGAWVLGRLADRRGRKTALMISVSCMCAGSAIIALVPGYATIGVGAPIALVVARLLQGLSVGGEFGASATYLAEVATPARRGFWGSFQYVTMILGQLSALGLLLLLRYVLLDEAALRAWGWRIPFAVGALLAVVLFYIRRRLIEAPQFVAADAATRDRAGLPELLRHRRAVLVVFGMAIGTNVSFYTYTTYMQKFLVGTSGFAVGEASLICAVSLIAFMLAQPLAGALSDRIGRKPLLYWYGIGGTLLTVPLLTAIGAAHTPGLAILLAMCALMILVGATSIGSTMKAELFPVGVRALGVGLPYAVSTSIFSGSAEYIALWFKSAGRESGFFWYVSGCIAVSLIAISFAPETRWRSCMDSGLGEASGSGAPASGQV